MRVAKKKAFEVVRAHCLAKRGAQEQYPWESVVWKVGGRIFAIGALGENAFTVKSTPADQSVLTQIPGVEAAAYVGRFGWVTVTATDTQSLALTRLLVDLSYEMVARRSRRGSRHPSSPRAARSRTRPRS
jgi:predicted DNA-binding protein (MmcQ/YjbR family)